MTKDRPMTGYDPAQFRRMTMLFVCLSLVNVAAVILAFYRTGFGLYHAEKALSHVSKITQCVLSVNENAQDILINWTDADTVDKCMQDISIAFSTISEQSEEYRSVDLSNIDAALQTRFENACMDTQRYQSALNEFTSSLKEDRMKNAEQITANYAENIEPLKSQAELSMNTLFDDQIKSTYDFFVRSAQQFLFVLLFLFLTMTVGIIGIAKMRRSTRHAAEVIAQEHEHSERMREKTFNIAYQNILTGFKNFYGLENDLSGRVGTEEFTVSLCCFNRFEQLREIYGRGRADEFITLVSQTLTKEFGDTADIYSTGADEFCFLFRGKPDLQETERIVRDITDTMSRNYIVDGEMMQKFASGCFYVCTPDAQDNISQLFFTLDRAMSIAKAQSLQNGQSAVLNVSSLS